MAGLAACAAVTLCATACGSGTTVSSKQTVTVFSTLTGVIPGTNELPWQEWQAGFEKANPSIHVNVITASSSSAEQAMYARIVAAKRAGKAPPVDIMDTTSLIPDLSAAGALVKLNTSLVPNLSKVPPAQLAAVKYMAVPYRGSSVVLAYNSSDVAHPPATLASLLTWIKAHPGKFTYNEPSGGGSGAAFAQSVVSQYIPASTLSKFAGTFNASLEKYWAPGLAELHNLTRYLYQGANYPKSNNDTLTDLANGAIWMGPVWSDGATAAISNGELPSSVKLTQISPPFYGGPADLDIIKGSQHVTDAAKLINYMLSSSAQQLVVSGMNGYPGVELKYEPSTVRAKFSSIDTVWSPDWNNTYNLDLANQWQQRVPGGG